ncbi:uncharacterized protein LOC111799489 isoform X1 [Cucurbita pepo subsp. pepo]|uniref:uncharacterized protein LOC111799489 isoform X1 n=2 Tax=Cucurbita pepo subsp. pepo TaxID=3664 RepID=UPI000C9D4F31|nr:uncharacterized protein LOC111799489 isoform X1 [Cucurbita pepo subsp. pepo]
MERLSAVASAASSLPERTTMASATSGYVSWYEDFISSHKGRREVRYYLKRSDGSLDLAVVGKEKSLRHMSYHYALQNRFLNSVGLFLSRTKLKSRREVVEWLSSVVSDSQRKTSQPSDRIMDKEGADARPSNAEPLKDVQPLRLGQYTRDFSWIGCPWTCKRKRRHYPSFSRNGVKISVHDFVYVLAEEGKRLVAYLEDMYEDCRSNRMVVVRWFHKIDEVDIDLPHNFNDREIFFSLCLQDLNIECIDGLATVLSPHHFQKFQNEAKLTQLEPYVCVKQFDNDDIKPFDITQVKGYWKQEILRYMYALSSSKAQGHSQHSEDDISAEMRPRKRHRRLNNEDPQNNEKRQPVNVSPSLDVHSSSHNLVGFKRSDVIFSPKGGCASKTFIGKELKSNSSTSQLTVGSEIEVLSQDSGIRGCWFRASIIKKRRDKVKVQYCDLQDANDESNKLVEWLSASRVAGLDQLGLRFNGRLVIRPDPGKATEGSGVYNVGTIVDVWWHDGWWEGIVVQKECEDKLRVYLPGEKKEAVFGTADLRHSQEWFGNRWMQMQERPDIATSILSRVANADLPDKVSSEGKLALSTQVEICDSKAAREGRSQSSEPRPNSNADRAKEVCTVRDLSKDGSLAKLRWTGSKKRSQPSSSSSSNAFGKRVEDASKSFPSPLACSSGCDRFMMGSSMKVVDHDNCKYLGESMFTTSVVPPLSSLVMSR